LWPDANGTLWAWTPDTRGDGRAACAAPLASSEATRRWARRVCSPPASPPVCTEACAVYGSGTFNPATLRDRAEFVRSARRRFYSTTSLQDIATFPNDADLCSARVLQSFLVEAGARRAASRSSDVPPRNVPASFYQPPRDIIGRARPLEPVLSDSDAARPVIVAPQSADVLRRHGALSWQYDSEKMAGRLVVEAKGVANSQPPFGARCDVLAPTAWNIVAAMIIASRRRASLASDSATATRVPAIRFAGDAPMRHLFFALVAAVRGQRFHLDRATRTSMRYTVSLTGDLLQISNDGSIPPQPAEGEGNQRRRADAAPSSSLLFEAEYVFSAFPASGTAAPTDRHVYNAGAIYAAPSPLVLVVGHSFHLVSRPLGDQHAPPPHAVQHHGPAFATDALSSGGDADGGGGDRAGGAATSVPFLSADDLEVAYRPFFEAATADLVSLADGDVRIFGVPAIDALESSAEWAEGAWRNDRVRAMVEAARVQWTTTRSDPFPVRTLELNALQRLLAGRVPAADHLNIGCSVQPPFPRLGARLRVAPQGGCSTEFERAALSTLLHSIADPGPIGLS
jgi:hypothetical protein